MRGLAHGRRWRVAVRTPHVLVLLQPGAVVRPVARAAAATGAHRGHPGPSTAGGRTATLAGYARAHRGATAHLRGHPGHGGPATGAARAAAAARSATGTAHHRHATDAASDRARRRRCATGSDRTTCTGTARDASPAARTEPATRGAELTHAAEAARA